MVVADHVRAAVDRARQVLQRLDQRARALLVERVGVMVRDGKSLDQIKRELRMPEYASWSYQERMPSNIEAAYRAVKGN